MHSDPYWRFATARDLVEGLDLALRDARQPRPATRAA
jgi:hypothetical protein